MKWEDQGCEKCRLAILQAKYPEKIGFSETRLASLHRCTICGAIWEKQIRIMSVIDYDTICKYYEVEGVTDINRDEVLRVLEESFSKEGWEKFKVVVHDYFERLSSDTKVSIDMYNYDKSLLESIVVYFGDDTERWLRASMKALAYYSPLEILNRDNGEEILKELVMRLPR